MDLQILTSNPELAKDITLQVKGSDLLDFATRLVQDTASEVEAKVKAENKPDELLTRQQVAKMLGATLTTLWHWDNKNILNPVRIGTKVRYRRSDVEKAMKKRQP
jgi:excisionase family DNA binding protein